MFVCVLISLAHHYFYSPPEHKSTAYKYNLAAAQQNNNQSNYHLTLSFLVNAKFCAKNIEDVAELREVLCENIELVRMILKEPKCDEDLANDCLDKCLQLQRTLTKSQDYF